MPSTAISLKRMEPQTWNILQLGLGFFLIFTAFNTQGFIEELVVQQLANSTSNSAGFVHESGFYSLATIYAVFTFANFVAAPIVTALSAKWAMCLGGLCYATFMAVFLRPVGWFLYLSSGILGFGAAIIWTGQGNYLTLNSNSETIGRNSGILWAMMQSCLVVGGIFLYFEFRGSESIQTSTVKIVYSVFLAVSGAGVICLSLLRRPPDRERDKRLLSSRSSGGTSANESREDLVESISAANPVVVDSVHTLESADQIRRLTIDEERKPDWIRDLVNTFKLLLTREMLLLAVVMFYTGIELQMWSSMYSTSLGNTNAFGKSVRQEIVALHGIFIGIGQILGGGSFGLLGHKTVRYGRNPIIILGTIVHLLCFFLVFLNIPADAPLGPTDHVAYFHKPNQYLALFCSFLFGLGDSSWNTQLYSILGSLYPDDSAPAFALFKFFQSLSAALSFFYGSHLMLHYQLLILGVFCFLGALAFFPVEFIAQSKPNGLKRA